MARKRHVLVRQDEFLDVMREVGQAILEDVAAFCDVSPATARRHLDGLVAQGKLTVHPGHNRLYTAVEEGQR